MRIKARESKEKKYTERECAKRREEEMRKENNEKKKSKLMREQWRME